MCDWFGFTTVDASSPRCPKAVVYLFFLELCPYNLSTLMKSIPYGGDVAAAIATPQSLAARIFVSILPVCRHRACICRNDGSNPASWLPRILNPLLGS